MSKELPTIHISADERGRGTIKLNDIDLSDYVTNFAIISEISDPPPRVTLEILAGKVTVDVTAAVKILEELEAIGALEVIAMDDADE